MVIDIEGRRIGKLVDTLTHERSRLIQLKSPFHLLHLTVNRPEGQLNSFTILETVSHGLVPVAFMGVDFKFESVTQAILSGVNLNEFSTDVGGIKVVKLDEDVIIPVSHTMFDDYTAGDIALAVDPAKRLQGWGSFLIQLSAHLAFQKGAYRLQSLGSEDTTGKYTRSHKSLYETALDRKKTETGSLSWQIELYSTLPRNSILEKI